MIGILMGGVSWSIYYIMRIAYLEMNDGTEHGDQDSSLGSESRSHDVSYEGANP